MISLKNIIYLSMLGLSLIASKTYAKNLENFNAFVDLNGDGIIEIIEGGYRWVKDDGLSLRAYEITARFSNHDGSHNKDSRRIALIEKVPTDIQFVDFEGDGDKDLIFIVEKTYSTNNGWYDIYSFTHMMKNDGKGNFGKPKLIDSQKKY